MTDKQRKTKGIPDTIDKHVGKQLKSRRSLLGLSQEKLAESVGVTFQQVQKYERGTNRISASRLFTFSKILDVSIDFFYQGMDNNEKLSSLHGMSDNDQEGFDSTSANIKKIPENLMSKKETIDVLKAYYSIEDEKKRKDFLTLIKSMAKNLS
ncbi:MAG: helix-turn-helix domain-containing protein [Alphaproteobacteria bacterium]